jgi:hypothetical protein
MKKYLVPLFVILLYLSADPAYPRNSYQTESELSSSARSAFEEILDLWRAGRYDELHVRTQISGKVAKEDFASRLENAANKPACCWQKMQDVTVQVENDDIAVIRAKVGLEGGGDIKYKTRSYRLVREGDRWRISQSDLFALAGAQKGKKGHRKKR